MFYPTHPSPFVRKENFSLKTSIFSYAPFFRYDTFNSIKTVSLRKYRNPLERVSRYKGPSTRDTRTASRVT